MSQQKRHASFLNEIYNLAISVIIMSSDDTYQPRAAGEYICISKYSRTLFVLRADISRKR